MLENKEKYADRPEVMELLNKLEAEIKKNDVLSPIAIHIILNKLKKFNVRVEANND